MKIVKYCCTICIDIRKLILRCSDLPLILKHCKRWFELVIVTTFERLFTLKSIIINSVNENF